MTTHSYVPAKTVAAVATGMDADIVWIKDRTAEITQDRVDAVTSRPWCGFAGRRPKPVTETPTDMDLVSYLPSLLRRGAVIEIDAYTRLTSRVDDAARRVGDVRFGQVVELVSHRSLLSFGLRLFDVSVVATDGYKERVGAPRTFTLLAPNGDWHAGPTKLNWQERADEAAFNDLHQLYLDQIKTFVHRNRVQSVMSAAYLTNKCLLVRLDDQIDHYRRQLRVDQSRTPALVRHRDVMSEVVPSFTMQVEGFELTGEYQVDICSTAYLKQLIAWRQQVQWLTRVNEYAFYRHGMAGGYTAPWVRGLEWQHTGAGQARLQLHPDLAISYQYQLISHATRATAMPLAPVLAQAA